MFWALLRSGRVGGGGGGGGGVGSGKGPQQVEEGGMLVFLLFLQFHSFSHPPLFLPFLLPTGLSVHFLPFTGGRQKMTHKGWQSHAVK